MTKWNNFLIRATSALVAVAIVIVLYQWLEVQGLKVLVTFAAIMGSIETIKILFKNEKSFFLKALFLSASLGTFSSSAFNLHIGTLIFAFCLISFLSIVLLTKNRSDSLENILSLQSRGSLGLFYCGLLPSFCFKILDLSHGASWFVFLLASVFAGDTLAYLVGVLWGKHKVMPNISPKKSWQGAVGGILGSLIAGTLCGILMFETISLINLMLLALIAGVAGQFGDFFESLMKRVADVKDSGRIMPGHGGVLDRIDGILFASPVILFGALILTH